VGGGSGFASRPATALHAGLATGHGALLR